MATRTVDLGTVGFGLTADSSSLAASLRTLKAFGQQVNALGDTAGWADPLYKKFTQIERTLSTIHGQVQRTTQRMREAGVAAAEIDKLEQAYRRLSRTMTHSAHGLGPAEMSRGITGMRAMLAQGNRMAGAQEASKFAVAFRDLERAAILAVGPLSGVGARLAVLSALFETTGAKMTLFIAGMTGAIAGFALTAMGAIKASMDMERFNAVLTASTGASQLAAKEYEYIIGVSDRLGQNVRSLVDPYGKFTTAARLSNLALDDQRLVFEGAMTAGTAMKLSNERMGLVFLAMEQMVSKGVVSMEELRRQLGDLLPGSMALAAQAMGKTEAELIRMVEAGEVMAKDLLPLLARKWLDVFGPAAQQAAQSLQAEMARVGTSTFEVLKAFDEATKVSSAFRTIVVATRQALDFLAGSMREVIALFGALGGGAIMLGAIAAWTRFGAAILTAVAAIRTATMTFASLAATVTMLLPGVGTVVGLLVRMGLVAAGAAMGYQLLNREQESSMVATQEWLKNTEDWIQLQHKLGTSHRQTTQEMMQGTATRLRMTYAEIGATQAQLAAMRLKRETELKMIELSTRSIRDPAKGKPGGLAVEKDASIVAMEERERQLRDVAANLESVIRQIQGLKLDPEAGVDTAGGTAFKNWVKTIEQSVREVVGLTNQIEAFERAGKGAATEAEGMAKAIEKVADMPDKKPGSIAKLQEDLRRAGFEGANLTEQLAALYTLIEQKKDALRAAEQLPKTIETSGRAVAEMFDALDARKKAIGVDPEFLRQQQALEKSVETLTDHLTKMGVSQEHVNFLVEHYRNTWQEIKREETGAKHFRELRDDLERLNETLGDSHERATRKHLDNIRKIKEGMANYIIGAVEGQRMIEAANDEMYKKMLDRSTVFGRALTEMFRDMERGISRTLAQMTLGQKTSFQDLMRSMLQQILEFAYQVKVVAPMMKALFGGAYTQKSADMGTGIFEGSLMSLAKHFGQNGPTVQPDNYTVDPYGYEGMAASQELGASGWMLDDATWMGEFATGGNFNVPGSGGVDSQIVAFKATPGEHVSVTPGGSSGGVNVVVNNNTGIPVEASVQPGQDPGQMVVDLFFQQLSKSAGARHQLAALTGRPRH